MTTVYRPPADTTATIDDFRSCGWSEYSAVDRSYFGWWDFCCTRGFEATKAGDFSKAKVLWLLGDACSLRLEPANINEPFVATQVNQFSKPVNLDSFDESGIALLSQVTSEVEDPLLKARVADIVWLCERPRRRASALTAIDAYRSTPLTEDSWLMTSRDCWRRAIALTMQLGAGAGARLEEMTDALRVAAERSLTTSPDSHVAISVTELLLECGLVEQHYSQLAELLYVRGERYLTEGNHFFARNQFGRAKQLFEASQLPLRRAEMAKALARAFEGEAIARTSGPHPSYMVATDHYTSAIQELYSVPKSIRAELGVTAELPRLYGLLREAGARSLDEFAPFETEPIDLKALIEEATDAASNKELLEALLALAECSPYAPKAFVVEETKQLMQRSFFSRVFGTSHLAYDGRVIHRTPAANDLSDGSSDTDAALWSEMVRHHRLRLRIAVQSAIVPTLRQLVLEHRVDEEDLRNIAARSRVVPQDRVWLIAKGLKAGFEGDFAVALHLLVPQLENFVRTHLKTAGAKTTTLAKDGTQMEVGLSKLVELAEMDDVFGPNLTYEIRCVFCDLSGPNLRNDLAHGLLPAGATRSAESIYAWWLVFKMVFSNYWLPPSAQQRLPAGA